MRRSQLFRKPVPISILIDFLETNGYKRLNGIIFSKASFKKSQMFGTLVPFLNGIKDYYHKTKQIYATRGAMSYKNIITIIRQICQYHHIPFTNRIKYEHSKYEIIYIIYLPAPITDISQP